MKDSCWWGCIPAKPREPVSGPAVHPQECVRAVGAAICDLHCPAHALLLHLSQKLAAVVAVKDARHANSMKISYS